MGKSTKTITETVKTTTLIIIMFPIGIYFARFIR